MNNQEEFEKLNNFLRMQLRWSAIFCLLMAAGCLFGIVMIGIALWKINHV